MTEYEDGGHDRPEQQKRSHAHRCSDPESRTKRCQDSEHDAAHGPDDKATNGRPTTEGGAKDGAQDADSQDAGDYGQHDCSQHSRILVADPVTGDRQTAGVHEAGAERDREGGNDSSPAQIDNCENEQHGCRDHQLRTIENAPTDGTEDGFPDEQQRPNGNQHARQEEQEQRDAAESRGTLELIGNLREFGPREVNMRANQAQEGAPGAAELFAQAGRLIGSGIRVRYRALRGGPISQGTSFGYV